MGSVLGRTAFCIFRDTGQCKDEAIFGLGSPYTGLCTDSGSTERRPCLKHRFLGTESRRAMAPCPACAHVHVRSCLTRPKAAFPCTNTTRCVPSERVRGAPCTSFPIDPRRHVPSASLLLAAADLLPEQAGPACSRQRARQGRAGLGLWLVKHQANTRAQRNASSGAALAEESELERDPQPKPAGN